MLGRILVFLGGLLVVALFGALLAPLFVDWTDFRKDFESQASRVLGKKVTVLGEVEARLLPFPSVTLHDVTVGADQDGKPLVHVARFSMDAELAPLLSGEARIFDMRIEEPRARIRLSADGTLDWLRGSSADIPARTVVLEKVRIVGGEIDFIDEQTGRTRKLTGLDADMSARSLAGPWSVDGKAALDGEAGHFFLSSLQPELGAEAISLKLRLQPDARPFDIELDGNLALKAGKPNYEGHFQAVWKGTETAKADPKIPPPRAKGDFELTNERIAVKSYRFELGDVADPYVVTGEAKLDTGANPEFLLTAEGQQVDVNRLANDSAKGKTGRNAAGSVRERLDLLIAMASEIPIPNLPGKATLRLPAIVAGDTVLRDVTLDVRPDGRGWNVERAVVVLPGRTQVEAKGRLVLGTAPSFGGDLLVASTQPSGLSTWISGGVDPAIRQLKSMGFSAAVNLTPQIQRFEKLELAIGPALLNGRLERQSLDKEAATLSIDLTGNEIDLDAARAVAGLIVGEEADHALLAEKIATRLKVGRLTGYGMQAGEVETVFTYDGTGVVIDRLNIGDLAGATIKASGTVKGPVTSPSGKTQVALSAVDPGPFLALVAERLPAHPLAARLVKSAPWYANSNLTASLVFGEAAGGGMAVKVAGTSNGSRIALDYGVDDLAKLTGDAKVNLAATIENPHAQILLGQAGLDPLPIGGGEGGRLQFSVNGAGNEPADATLTVAAGRTTLSARGKIGLAAAGFPKGSGTVKLESPDLEPYLMMTGVLLPQGGAGLPARLGAEVTLGDGKAAISAIDAEAAGNRITGALSVDWNGAVPKVGGELALDSVDLAWLAEGVLGPVTEPGTGAVSAAPLPKPRSDFEFNLAFTAKSFAPGVFSPIADFSGKLNGAGGQLTLEDAAGRWLGGTMSGRLMVANTDGNGFYQGRISLRQADLTAVEKAIGRVDDAGVLEGKLDLDLVAEATGANVSDLLAATNGSGTAKVPALTVRHLDSGLLPKILPEADAIEGEVTADKVQGLAERLLGGAPSAFANVEVPFNITDGVLRVTTLSLANDSAKLDGTARVDLAGRRTEADIRMAFAAGDDALAGAEPGVRLLLSGDVGNPERKLDVGDLANFLSQRAFERERRRVETLQSNVLEKQRLRREAALYRFRAEERATAAAERARIAEEVRLKAEAERRAAEEEARRKAAEAAQQQALPPAGETGTPQLPVTPGEGVTRGGALPPVQLQFEGLPGVN
ncbi:AsmA family protein [Ciceribacter selenitireducens]